MGIRDPHAGFSCPSPIQPGVQSPSHSIDVNAFPIRRRVNEPSVLNCEFVTYSLRSAAILWAALGWTPGPISAKDSLRAARVQQPSSQPNDIIVRSLTLNKSKHCQLLHFMFLIFAFASEPIYQHPRLMPVCAAMFHIFALLW